jgi:hypothetical protein
VICVACRARPRRLAVLVAGFGDGVVAAGVEAETSSNRGWASVRAVKAGAERAQAGSCGLDAWWGRGLAG